MKIDQSQGLCNIDVVSEKGFRIQPFGDGFDKFPNNSCFTHQLQICTQNYSCAPFGAAAPMTNLSLLLLSLDERERAERPEENIDSNDC